MRYIIVGDLHGHDTWRRAIARFGEPVAGESEYVFLGDYFDGFKIQPEDAIANFNELMAWAAKYGEAVHTCIGNHDWHYWQKGERYSGYTNYAAGSIRSALEKYLGRLHVAFMAVHSGICYIFSHAGITNYWKNNILEKDYSGLFAIPSDIVTNRARSLDWNSFVGFSPYGDTISNSPIWVRPNALADDMYSNDECANTYQIVGHTDIHCSVAEFSAPIQSCGAGGYCFNSSNDKDTYSDGTPRKLSKEGDKIILCDAGPYITVIDTETRVISRALV